MKKNITYGEVMEVYSHPISVRYIPRIFICLFFLTISFIDTLKKGLELLAWLEEDLENVGAEDYHQLMRAWELKHRTITSQCVTEHTLFRQETRWPGYYYRGDYMKLDDENWHCLTLSRRDPKTGKFTMEKAPVYHIVDEKEKKEAS